MHTRIARIFAAELGLSLSVPPVELPDIQVSALWHASYDRDPGHSWLRRVVSEIVAELRPIPPSERLDHAVRLLLHS